MKCEIFSALLFNFLILINCEIIEIEDGRLEGRVMQTRKGVNFHAFLKIPFAQPPVGSLRFQPPVRNEKWDGVLNATEYGPMCIQSVGRYNISENCLHLNVFTKNLASDNRLQPVIVFIHGGSFDEGSARNHQALYLMDRDVVLVTINYRIGALGFLSTGTEAAIGNMGLKDQVLALQWVQRNIAMFGGDAKSVTITGLSAGGYSVTAHMASPMSKGLFHRVIAMSGSITKFKRLKNDYLDLAKHLAINVNCSTSDIAAMVKCMQEKPAEKFMHIDLSAVKDCQFSMSYYPVIEIDFGQERFLSENPNDILSNSSRIPNVDLMIGITEHEMHYGAPLLLKSPQLIQQLENNLSEVMYQCFDLQSTPNDVSLLRPMYFPFDTIDQRSFDGLGNFFSDGIIGYGTHTLAHMISNYTNVYLYKFTYIGRYSVFNYPRTKPYGMSHADDIQYVLNTWYVGDEIGIDDPENLLIERMTRIWEQFALKGNPNNLSDEYLSEMNWPKHDAVNEYYLDIGQHLIEKHGLFLERFSVWDNALLQNTTVKIHLNLLLMIFISFFIKLM